MTIFLRQNQSNLTKLHHIFSIFLREHVPEPPSICATDVIISIKIVILYSEIFQIIHQYAKIVTCFQKFLHEPVTKKDFL